MNLLLTVLVLSLYSIRWTLLRRVSRKESRLRDIVLVLAAVAVIAAICLYIHLAFKSIVFNSGICLELYKVNLIDRYTAVVYLSFLALSLTIPLLVQLISPLLRRLIGFRYDMFSRTGRLVFAVVAGAYFATASSLFGFQKEKNRVEVWANRLAMDRDISLELQLRAAEAAISEDSVIGALSLLDNSHEMIRGRLANTYLTRISQDYDISVILPTPSLATDVLFNERIRSGVRLADNSHFFYSTGTNGRAQYSGVFPYFNPEYGSSSVLVLVESKSNREDRGYLSLLGLSEPGRVSMPPYYSYARYVDDHLVLYKGDFPYATVVSDRFRQVVGTNVEGSVVLDGYMHFVQPVQDKAPRASAQDARRHAFHAQGLQHLGHVDALPARVQADGADPVDMVHGKIRDHDGLVQRRGQGNGIDHFNSFINIKTAPKRTRFLKQRHYSSTATASSAGAAFRAGMARCT